MGEHNYKEVWLYAMNQIYEDYKNDGKETEFKLWFNMEYIEDTLTTITVAVSSEFFWQMMVNKGNIATIEKKIREITGQPNIQIKRIIKNILKDEQTPSSVEHSSEKETIKKIYPTGQKTKPQIALQSINNIPKKHPLLKAEYTFDSFVPGDNSLYAYNAALAVAENPGKAYNPILLYGGVGLGKTHLMQSIGNRIYQKNGDKMKICYISAETFTNEFVNSINTRTTDKFKSKYRNLDIFLLDDIHFLQNKDGTQEELFYTFNALHDNNSQMVFTCDRPIGELKGVTERLRSRFSNGLCIDLQPPNYETRRAILKKKLEILHKSIPDDVLDYIAKNIVTNVRDLESAMTKMIGYADLIRKTPTIEVAQQLLRDAFHSPVSQSINIDVIQKAVADQYNISLSDIKGKKRDKKIVLPRQIAIYIARELINYSFPELGNEFGGRDHTTAMHAYEKIQSLLKTDSSLDSTIRMLIRKIKDYKSK